MSGRWTSPTPDGARLSSRAVIDWASRRILSHRVSITMEADFCVEALEEALAKYGKPEIFNTDQGSQFTGEASPACCSE